MLTKPVHTLEVLARHAIWEQIVWTREENLQCASLSKRVILEAAAALEADPLGPHCSEVPIEMLDSEKTQYNNGLENLPREECTADKTQRAGILSHPQSVHSIASSQNEAGYQLE
jgi:hypothetical protein